MSEFGNAHKGDCIMMEAAFWFAGGLVVGWFLLPAPAGVVNFWKNLFG
jgi:hypothetical protein